MSTPIPPPSSPTPSRQPLTLLPELFDEIVFRYLRASSPDIEVRHTGRASRRNSLTQTSLGDGSTSLDIKVNLSGLSVEWGAEVIDADLGGLVPGSRSASDLDTNLSRERLDEGVDKDLVLDNFGDGGGGLVGNVVTDGATVVARCGRGKTVPVGESLLFDRTDGTLVLGDVVREELAESIVNHALGVRVCVLSDVLTALGTNVGGFTEIVPGEDLKSQQSQEEGIMGNYLDHGWLISNNLLPAGVPEIITAPNPVLLVLRHVGVEPRRDGHHVRLILDTTAKGVVQSIGH
jgi:hypothetical protein